MDFPFRDYTEKRRHVRMLMECPVIYGPAGSNERHQAICLDLSVSGIRFRSTEPVEPGAQLNVVVKTESRFWPPLLALVDVLRVEPMDAESGYDVAGRIARVVG